MPVAYLDLDTSLDQKLSEPQLEERKEDEKIDLTQRRRFSSRAGSLSYEKDREHMILNYILSNDQI